MKKKCEPKLVKSVVLGKYYCTDDYEDLGNGKLICNTKREATQEEIDTLMEEGEQ